MANRTNSNISQSKASSSLEGATVYAVDMNSNARELAQKLGAARTYENVKLKQ